MCESEDYFWGRGKGVADGDMNLGILANVVRG